MYRKILVACDGSEHSGRALARAGELGRRLGAKVVAVTVLHIPAAYMLALGSSIAMGDEPWQALVRTCDQVLDGAEKQLGAYGVRPAKAMRRGDPAGEILALAQEDQVDLIIMGSRGRGQAKAHLLGSVSDRVSHAAGCDVLIVR